jgi:hypothetical protein
MEYELAEIYKRLCNGETDLQIMTKLCLHERNYYNYKKRLQIQLMEYQRKNTNNTIFIESNFFKNRMLNLYKALEDQITSDETSGTDKAKCAEIAASIALDVLKMESQGIRFVTEIISKNNNNNKTQRGLENLGSQSKNDDESNDIKKDFNPNRKF